MGGGSLVRNRKRKKRKNKATKWRKLGVGEKEKMVTKKKGHGQQKPIEGHVGAKKGR